MDRSSDPITVVNTMAMSSHQRSCLAPDDIADTSCQRRRPWTLNCRAVPSIFQSAHWGFGQTIHFADRGLFCAGRVEERDMRRVAKATHATF